MEAKELRIGNLIMYESTIDDWENIRVKSGTIIQVDISPDSYHPIPITDEWLKSFGFKLYGESDYPNSPSDWYWCKIGFDFSIAYKTKKVQHTNNKLKYVHQLQNLYFALTGEELELSSNVA